MDPLRIWNKDVTLFTGADPAVVRNRLGWLDAPDAMTAHVEALNAFADGARQDGIDHVYLLGMGGSSLCAEVLRDAYAAGTPGAKMTVLDTTDEKTIVDTSRTLNPHKSLFLVSSKSGSTIEVTSLERHFFTLMSRTLGDEARRHFVAITDPETSLASHAEDARYRQTFLNPADIGGRYSALSLFGLVPAALIGWNVSDLLRRAREMAEECRHDDHNPGLALGEFIATHANTGRNKLTLLAPPALATVGLWIEQLIAESTGKMGRGVLPIVGEPLGTTADYGPDRAFVAMTNGGDDQIVRLAGDLESAGHPVFRIATSAGELGAEFFRWEFATAVAGALIGVNPFDEPNVKEAKMKTQALIDSYLANGTLRIEPALVRRDDVLRREHARRHAPRDREHGPFVILDYMPPQDTRKAAADRVRSRVRHASLAATTYGVGPRYLHSTGQYHKGGPNEGTFVILTGADRSATPIPGTHYTFSVLKHAQALGDFEALAAADRHVIHYHFDDPETDFSGAMERLL